MSAIVGRIGGAGSHCWHMAGLQSSRKIKFTSTSH